MRLRQRRQHGSRRLCGQGSCGSARRAERPRRDSCVGSTVFGFGSMLFEQFSQIASVVVLGGPTTTATNEAVNMEATFLPAVFDDVFLAASHLCHFEPVIGGNRYGPSVVGTGDSPSEESPRVVVVGLDSGHSMELSEELDVVANLNVLAALRHVYIVDAATRCVNNVIAARIRTDRETAEAE
jgi:hypothetical protein